MNTPEDSAPSYVSAEHAAACDWAHRALRNIEAMREILPRMKHEEVVALGRQMGIFPSPSPEWAAAESRRDLKRTLEQIDRLRIGQPLGS